MQDNAPSSGLSNLEELRKVLESARLLVEASRGKIPRSRMPYATPENANGVKAIVDRVLATGKSEMVLLANMRPATLKAKWYQGLAYLRDTMKDKYGDINKRIKTSYVPGKGLLVFPVTSLLTTTVEWRDRVVEFLENSRLEGEILRIGDISLDTNDLAWLADTLKPLESIFAYDYTGNLLRIVRVVARTDSQDAQDDRRGIGEEAGDLFASMSQARREEEIGEL